jgi:hypothetical protein
MKGFLITKLGWVLVVLHAIVFGIAMYQRAGQFHFYYEPLAIKIVVLADFIWLWIADLIGIGSLQEPTSTLLFMAVFGSIQWFLIGYGISRMMNRKTPTANG